MASSVSENRKLTVIVRVEPGCLGPEGMSHIEEFCKFIYAKESALDYHFVNWSFIPRYDKDLSEFEFQIDNRKITPAMANKYLQMFSKELNAFEDELHDHLADYIEEYLAA
ncbi:hypothetical protein H0A36_11125 [Endozoicomonas sp. SM1973]|uniref:Orphan protein n=1 Tax=Spartinivicinus marinus TaxID=2994442 RepID=A0A853HXS9_9GAMM|nr:hypothetical protein [Spartinivicinus marinus]MCX4026077.1 hypothetical protein [Spartinivicinus marinus]NYZ66560.1 hypothetical protein [Spartinivicinus marinus]